MTMGHWNWSGREKMMVETYESSSKTFWNVASTVEKVPR
jgi:hypothetical protein